VTARVRSKAVSMSANTRAPPRSTRRPTEQLCSPSLIETIMGVSTSGLLTRKRRHVSFRSRLSGIRCLDRIVYPRIRCLPPGRGSLSFRRWGQWLMITGPCAPDPSRPKRNWRRRVTRPTRKGSPQYHKQSVRHVLPRGSRCNVLYGKGCGATVTAVFARL
jgi:hypothetical protein